MLSLKHRRSVRSSTRPGLEVLEDRCVLSGNVLQTNLVSDLPGVAQFTDPNLVNPWGISESAGSPFWISDNNAGVSTLYKDEAGQVRRHSLASFGPGDKFCPAFSVVDLLPFSRDLGP